MIFTDSLTEISLPVEKRLAELLKTTDIDYSVIFEAMRYSTLGGGKRLRAALVVKFAEIFGGDKSCAIDTACAIEMIHAYSLIHDDLPCMDDDNFRRGKPSNHIIFGEAIALLTGDALLTTAFETISNLNLSADKTVSILKIISSLVGTNGMIGGQIMDMAWEKQIADLETVTKINSLKTGKLILASCLAGAAIGDCSKEKAELITSYAEAIGFAFQVTDDILDVIGNEKKLGKPIGSDKDNDKSNYVSLCGLDKSRILATEHIEKAIDIGEKISTDIFLVDLAKFILSREK